MSDLMLKKVTACTPLDCYRTSYTHQCGGGGIQNQARPSKLQSHVTHGSRPTRGGTVRRHTIACKSRSPTILTVGYSSQRVFCLRSVRSGWTDPTRDHRAATKTNGPNSTHAPPDVGRRASESRPYYKVSLSRLCSQRHQSRSELSMQYMFWMGVRKMFQDLKCSSES